jgi:hypothetical protein
VTRRRGGVDGDCRSRKGPEEIGRRRVRRKNEGREKRCLSRRERIGKKGRRAMLSSTEGEKLAVTDARELAGTTDRRYLREMKWVRRKDDEEKVVKTHCVDLRATPSPVHLLAPTL